MVPRSLVATGAPVNAGKTAYRSPLKGPGGKPLPQASVSLRNKQGLIVHYAISSDKGTFQLSLPDTTHLTGLSLEVTHLGYKRLLTPLQEGKYAYELQLEEQAVLLPEVLVKNRPIHFQQRRYWSVTMCAPSLRKKTAVSAM